jgi:hypothetical protein
LAVATIGLSGCETEDPIWVDEKHRVSDSGASTADADESPAGEMDTGPALDATNSADGEKPVGKMDTSPALDATNSADGEKPVGKMDTGPALDATNSADTDDGISPTEWGECGPRGLAEAIPGEAARAAEEALGPNGMAGKLFPCSGGQTVRLGEAAREGFLDEAKAASSNSNDDFLTFNNDKYFFVAYCNDQRGVTIKVKLSEGKWQTVGVGEDSSWFEYVDAAVGKRRAGCTVGEFMFSTRLGGMTQFYVIADEERGPLVYQFDMSSSTMVWNKEEFLAWVKSEL